MHPRVIFTASTNFDIRTHQYLTHIEANIGSQRLGCTIATRYGMPEDYARHMLAQSLAEFAEAIRRGDPDLPSVQIKKLKEKVGKLESELDSHQAKAKRVREAVLSPLENSKQYQSPCN